MLALYFASSGVESLRVGLNRAYGLRETRAWWFTRLESIAFVIFGAFVMLGFAVLVVFGPPDLARIVYWLPRLAAARLAGRLPAHRRGDDPDRRGAGRRAQVRAGRAAAASGRILPGIGITLVLWILGGVDVRLVSRELSRRLRLDLWRPRDAR